MIRKTMILVVPALLAFGCDDNANKTDGSTTPADLTMAGKMPDLVMTSMPDLIPPGPPAPPAIGDQIDRMGRPAVNTALTDPFDTIMGQSVDMTKNLYNAAADRTMWPAKFVGMASMTAHTYIAGNLGVFDGLDVTATPGDGCGNQVGFAIGGGNTYATLAGVLADDVLYVDTSQNMCNLYLGVEAHALLGTAADCGGRTPTFDVIDETYTLLSVGAAGIGMGPNGFAVTDGINKDADGNASNTTFPFFGNPN